MQLKSLNEVLQVDLDNKSDGEVIIGIKITLENNNVNYAAAVFNKKDINDLKTANTPLEKLSIYHIKKKKIVFSTPKSVGLFNFIEKEYEPQKLEEMIDAAINFKLNKNMEKKW